MKHVIENVMRLEAPPPEVVATLAVQAARNEASNLIARMMKEPHPHFVNLKCLFARVASDGGDTIRLTFGYGYEPTLQWTSSVRVIGRE